MTRCIAGRGPAFSRRASSLKPSGRVSVKVRGVGSFFGFGRAAGEDTEKKELAKEVNIASATKRDTPSSKATIDALSALLGVEDAEEAERKAEEEADVARSEAQQRLENLKAAKSKRLKDYLSVSTATLRSQQLQMLFLDMPVMPPFAQSLFLEDKTLENKTSGDTSAPSVFDEWFEVELPNDSTPNTSIISSTADAKERTVDVFGEDLTPAFTEYSGERLPNEFSLPIVPYPYVCLPGSLVRLNLFEPRWLTLFAKMLTKKSEYKSDNLVLEGARDTNRIDLARNLMVRAYEAEDTGEFDIVPGSGRFDEGDFVGTQSFGALYRGTDGKVACVGSVMKVEAHDVVVDGQLLSVYAKGTTRFKVLRVRQVNPYLVVDAVPIGDEEFLRKVEKDDNKKTVQSFTNNIVRGSADEADRGVVAGLEPVECKEDEPSLTPLVSAAGLARTVERLIQQDKYYSEAVGLEEAWRSTDLKKSVNGMNDFDVANAMLYAKPELALALLACEDDAKRVAMTENFVFGMEAAIAAGLTPRKARLLKSLSAFVALFALGFSIAYIRDAVEANWQ